jgi:hypothetical protein
MEESRLDFLGYQICLGDDVVFIEQGYRNLMRGKIIAVNSKKATIQLENRYDTRKKTQRFYSDLLKVRTQGT